MRGYGPREFGQQVVAQLAYPEPRGDAWREIWQQLVAKLSAQRTRTETSAAYISEIVAELLKKPKSSRLAELSCWCLAPGLVA